MRHYYGRKNAYEGLTESEGWALDLTGWFLRKKLLEKYETKQARTSLDEISAESIACDGRRGSSVRKALIKQGFIDHEYSSLCHPHEEKVLEWANIHQKAPDFENIKLFKEQRESWRKAIPMDTREEAYKDINDFTMPEICYIYLHQKEYDFKKVSKTYHSSMYTSGETVEYIKIFPIALMSSTEQKLFETKLNEYILNSVGDALRVMGIGSKVLVSDTRDEKIGGDPCILWKERAWTEEEIQKACHGAILHIRHYQQALKELRAWRKSMRAAGGAIKWYSSVSTKMREWLLEQLPLLVNETFEDVTDSDVRRILLLKKELGVLMAKGRDQGRID